MLWTIASVLLVAFSVTLIICGCRRKCRREAERKAALEALQRAAAEGAVAEGAPNTQNSNNNNGSIGQPGPSYFNESQLDEGNMFRRPQYIASSLGPRGECDEVEVNLEELGAYDQLVERARKEEDKRMAQIATYIREKGLPPPPYHPLLQPSAAMLEVMMLEQGVRPDDARRLARESVQQHREHYKRYMQEHHHQQQQQPNVAAAAAAAATSSPAGGTLQVRDIATLNPYASPPPLVTAGLAGPNQSQQGQSGKPPRREAPPPPYGA